MQTRAQTILNVSRKKILLLLPQITNNLLEVVRYLHMVRVLKMRSIRCPHTVWFSCLRSEDGDGGGCELSRWHTWRENCACGRRAVLQFIPVESVEYRQSINRRLSQRLQQGTLHRRANSAMKQVFIRVFQVGERARDAGARRAHRMGKIFAQEWPQMNRKTWIRYLWRPAGWWHRKACMWEFRVHSSSVCKCWNSYIFNNLLLDVYIF